MAKKGQHQPDASDPTKSKGHNNPKNSMTITAGTPKKQETYKRQAAEGKAVDKQAQAAKNEWTEDFRDQAPRHEQTRARNPRSGRSGSDSNANRGSRGG